MQLTTIKVLTKIGKTSENIAVEGKPTNQPAKRLELLSHCDAVTVAVVNGGITWDINCDADRVEIVDQYKQAHITRRTVAECLAKIEEAAKKYPWIAEAKEELSVVNS